jgi:hypothetical protein
VDAGSQEDEIIPALAVANGRHPSYCLPANQLPSQGRVAAAGASRHVLHSLYATISLRDPAAIVAFVDRMSGIERLNDEQVIGLWAIAESVDQ